MKQKIQSLLQNVANSQTFTIGLGTLIINELSSLIKLAEEQNKGIEELRKQLKEKQNVTNNKK